MAQAPIICYAGKSQSVSAWARERGLSQWTLWNRLYNLKWSVERALTEPITRTEPKCLTFRGVTKTVYAWARGLGLGEGTIDSRLKHGWSLERALTTPALKRGDGVWKTRRTHGLGGTVEYSAWKAIVQRCYNPNYHNYRYYGGRGIRMCNRWRNSFEVFLKDVGQRPNSKTSLDRIDNNGHYEPGNVRWATAKEQARNRRTSRSTTRRGAFTADEWAKRLDVSYQWML